MHISWVGKNVRNQANQMDIPALKRKAYQFNSHILELFELID